MQLARRWDAETEEGTSPFAGVEVLSAEAAALHQLLVRRVLVFAAPAACDTAYVTKNVLQDLLQRPLTRDFVRECQAVGLQFSPDDERLLGIVEAAIENEGAEVVANASRTLF